MLIKKKTRFRNKCNNSLLQVEIQTRGPVGTICSSFTFLSRFFLLAFLRHVANYVRNYIDLWAIFPQDLCWLTSVSSPFASMETERENSPCRSHSKGSAPEEENRNYS